MAGCWTATGQTVSTPTDGIAVGNWAPHTVYQLNGSAPPIQSPAVFQHVSEKWNSGAGIPYMVYIPEQKRVLMTLGEDFAPCKTMYSDDMGATWSDPKLNNVSLGLTYLANGKLITTGESPQYVSLDYGETWRMVRGSQTTTDGKTIYTWDPALVDKDESGNVIRLVNTGWAPLGENSLQTQGYIKFSTDEGETWTNPTPVPEWLGANEIALVRAKNGWIVAACRTNAAKELAKVDHYCGMGTSVSKDNGKTWSKIKMLYSWGRHHPSMVTLPNGDIVMSYLVRRGYSNTNDGLLQFGIEAIVSHDNGQTWDLDHKYILVSWAGDNASNAPQCTTTVLLPDNSMLTAFGNGMRAKIDFESRKYLPTDASVVRWRLNEGKLNKATRISEAEFDSKTRNEFDLNAFHGISTVPARKDARNIAVPSMEVKMDSSHILHGSLDTLVSMGNSYYYTPSTVFDRSPAWLTMAWPKAHTINEIVIYPGESAYAGSPSTECAPLDYKIQCRNDGVWQDIVDVKNAQSFPEYIKANPNGNSTGYKFVHKFAPTTVKEIRLVVTRSSDMGFRETSPDKPIGPPEERATILRRIEVYESAK